jgi:hypothetical protein
MCGWTTTEAFTRKLGGRTRVAASPMPMAAGPARKGRTTTVSLARADRRRRPLPPKDANEALLAGWDIDELLEEATKLPHERISRFSDLRDQAMHEIMNPGKYQGCKLAQSNGCVPLW